MGLEWFAAKECVQNFGRKNFLENLNFKDQEWDNTEMDTRKIGHESERE
jgi:hypothetical protein